MGRPTAQEIADIRNQPKIEEAYRRSLTTTEEAPADKEDFMGMPSPKIKDKIRGQRGYAKGGSVSSRADGIAQRGKTRGKMC